MIKKKFNIHKAIKLMTESQKMDVVNWYADTFNTIEDVPIAEVEFYIRELSSDYDIQK